jgi:hypothetical protein
MEPTSEAYDSLRLESTVNATGAFTAPAEEASVSRAGRA